MPTHSSFEKYSEGYRFHMQYRRKYQFSLPTTAFIVMQIAFNNNVSCKHTLQALMVKCGYKLMYVIFSHNFRFNTHGIYF